MKYYIVASGQFYTTDVIHYLSNEIVHKDQAPGSTTVSNKIKLYDTKDEAISVLTIGNKNFAKTGISFELKEVDL
jgi:hypothetical protein